MASTSKQEKKTVRSVKPEFFDLYCIEEVNGKGVCVMCQAAIPNESLKANKLERHMKTHTRVAALDIERRKCAFQRYTEQNSKSRRVMQVSLNHQQEISLFTLKTAFLIAKNKRPYVDGEVITKPTLMNFAKIFYS